LLGVSLSGFGREDGGTQLSFDLAPIDLEVEADGSGSSFGATPEAPLADTHDEVERIQETWSPVSAAVDAVRERYGGASVGPASLVGDGGLAIKRRGQAQWGPSETRSPARDDE
jgi:hypothetical protein